jgi:hypothetical protein
MHTGVFEGVAMGMIKSLGFGPIWSDLVGCEIGLLTYPTRRHSLVTD